MVRTAIDVAVAVVRDAAGQVLLAERTARQMAAGFWELPGGKIEPGETPLAAAARELFEETGLTAGSLQPLMAYHHAFPTRILRLHFFTAPTWHGTPSGREGQRLAWADPAAPGVAPILASNHRVLTALGLPRRLSVVDLTAPAQLHAALVAGATLLLLRGDRLAPDQRVAMARRMCQQAHAAGARALLAGSAQEAARAGAGGLHSTAASLRAMVTRPPVTLWSVACQGAEDVRHAEALGADLAVLQTQTAGPQPGTAARLPSSGGLALYAQEEGDQVIHAAPPGGARAAAMPPRAWLASGATAGAERALH